MAMSNEYAPLTNQKANDGEVSTIEVSCAIPEWASSIVDIMQGNKFCCRGIASLIKIRNGSNATSPSCFGDSSYKYFIMIPGGVLNLMDLEKYSLRFSVSKIIKDGQSDLEKVYMKQHTKILSKDIIRRYPRITEPLIALEIVNISVVNRWQNEGLRFREITIAKKQDVVLLADSFSFEGNSELQMNSVTISAIFEDRIELEKPGRMNEHNLGIPLLSEETISIIGITMRDANQLEPNPFYCLSLEKVLNTIKENEKWLPVVERHHQWKSQGKGIISHVYHIPEFENPVIAVKEINGIKESWDINVLLQEFVDFEEHLNEIRSLKHDRIVPILSYCVNVIDIRAYIFMEYMHGRSLGKIVHADGRVGDQRALKYISQILEGLIFLDGKLMIHGNLKPSNVFLDAQDNCKLSDIEGSQNDNIKRYIRTKSRFKLKLYQSPELLKGNDNVFPSATDDIWSVGAILVYIWSGKRLNNDVSELKSLEQISNYDLRIESINIKSKLEEDGTNQYIKLFLENSLCPKEVRADCYRLSTLCHFQASGISIEKIKDSQIWTGMAQGSARLSTQQVVPTNSNGALGLVRPVRSYRTPFEDLLAERRRERNMNPCAITQKLTIRESLSEKTKTDDTIGADKVQLYDTMRELTKALEVGASAPTDQYLALVKENIDKVEIAAKTWSDAICTRGNAEDDKLLKTSIGFKAAISSVKIELDRFTKYKDLFDKASKYLSGIRLLFQKFFSVPAVGETVAKSILNEEGLENLTEELQIHSIEFYKAL